MAHTLGENDRGGARSSNGDGGALRTRSEGERAREKELTAQMAAEEEAGTAGRSWWPTRARPGRRMRATRWPSSAGMPRRHGAPVRARGRGHWRGEGVDALVGWAASASGPEARPRPASAPLSLFQFFLISFSKYFSKLILTHLKSF